MPNGEQYANALGILEAAVLWGASQIRGLQVCSTQEVQGQR